MKNPNPEHAFSFARQILANPMASFSDNDRPDRIKKKSDILFIHLYVILAKQQSLNEILNVKMSNKIIDIFIKYIYIYL